MHDAKTIRLTCEEIDERIEDAVDGALSAEAELLVREHLRDCPACAAQHEAACLLRGELAAHFERAVDAGDLEPVAVQATVRAFNAIEASHRGPRLPKSARPRWLRRAVLLGGWVGAILVGIRAVSLAVAIGETPAAVTGAVDVNPALVFAASFFSTTPLYFVAGLALLVIAAGYSIKTALERD